MADAARHEMLVIRLSTAEKAAVRDAAAARGASISDVVREHLANLTREHASA